MSDGSRESKRDFELRFLYEMLGIIPLGLEGESTMVERDTSRVNISCGSRGSLQT